MTGGQEKLETLIPREVFKAEVRTWALRVGVPVKELHVRPMGRKWASCSSRGRLSFSTQLLEQPVPVQREAIVHELVHLKVGGPQHGKMFQALMRSYLWKYA